MTGRGETGAEASPAGASVAEAGAALLRAARCPPRLPACSARPSARLWGLHAAVAFAVGAVLAGRRAGRRPAAAPGVTGMRPHLR